MVRRVRLVSFLRCAETSHKRFRMPLRVLNRNKGGCSCLIVVSVEILASFAFSAQPNIENHTCECPAQQSCFLSLLQPWLTRHDWPSRHHYMGSCWSTSFSNAILWKCRACGWLRLDLCWPGMRKRRNGFLLAHRDSRTQGREVCSK